MARTEAPHDQHPDLDRYDDAALVGALLADQALAAQAVQAAQADLVRAVAAAVPRLQRGGRLVTVGAGTSGRLGLLDGVELRPTFSWPADRAVGVLAGGRRAMFHAVEGAEDDAAAGAADLAAIDLAANDVVLLVSASGSTPYVLGALQAARGRGALTIALANNPGAPLLAGAEIMITLDTGPELISGSTRLKAGTAQKIALNTFSSAVMVRLHKVYGNLMVDLQATNAKLHRRAVALTMHATGCDEAAARHALQACAHQVKLAIVVLQAGVDVDEARARLAGAHGSVHGALGGGPGGTDGGAVGGG